MINGVLPDPRLNAYRDDLAAEELRGRMRVPRYVKGELRQVSAPAIPLRRASGHDAELLSEALFGETLRVFDEAEGFAFIQLTRDCYVGYVPSERLTANVAAPTHKVTALRSYVFPRPDIKTPPVSLLSMNARLSLARAEGRFLELAAGGFLFAQDARPIAWNEPDYVAVAERFLGTPYLWGGRTSIGLDCSALVQLSLEAAGMSCPRDSDLQADALGKSIDWHSDTQLRRGDLVFWEGHVGIMLDAETLLHANVHHMAVEKEPLAEARRRILQATGGDIMSVRRLSVSSE